MTDELEAVAIEDPDAADELGSMLDLCSEGLIMTLAEIGTAPPFTSNLTLQSLPPGSRALLTKIGAITVEADQVGGETVTLTGQGAQLVAAAAVQLGEDDPFGERRAQEYSRVRQRLATGIAHLEGVAVTGKEVAARMQERGAAQR